MASSATTVRFIRSSASWHWYNSGPRIRQTRIPASRRRFSSSSRCLNFQGCRPVQYRAGQACSKILRKSFESRILFRKEIPYVCVHNVGLTIHKSVILPEHGRIFQPHQFRADLNRDHECRAVCLRPDLLRAEGYGVERMLTISPMSTESTPVLFELTGTLCSQRKFL